MRLAACALMVASAAFPATALADKPDKHKERRNDERAADRVQVTVTFGPREREAVRGYFVETRGRGACPPGLAKKHNGCLPPGQAKKRYAIGRRLPPRIVLEDPPPELVVRIGPPPRGYRYAIVDGDLVKLAVGTLLVVDAINGLVN
jgi:hypothetical protein